MPRGPACGPSILAILALFLVPARARAEGPYEGSWTSSTIRMDVAVHSWGDDCGPRPQSLTQPGGGAVPITQDGDNLTFHGRRTTRTNACWSENRAVHLVSTSVQGGSWRTICRTAPDDPRSETGTYTLRAIGGDQLSRTDVSEYDWQLNGSHCTATVTETQTFNRVRDANVVTPPPPPPPHPDTHPSCTPGAAAHLAVRPSDVTVQPGERTCFHARVTDATGCALPNAAVTWALEKPPTLRGELADGCFHAADTAAEAEGTFRVTATSGALHDAATIVVRTEDLSDLIAHRTETGGVTAATADATSSEAAQVAARTEGGSGRGSLVAPLVGAAVALFLVLAVLVVLVAGRKKKSSASAARPMASASAAAPVAGAPSPPSAPAASAQAPSPGRLVCPSCHNEFPGDTVFCPNDGARLVSGPGAPNTAAPAQGMICPTCRRGFPADAKFCPADSEELVPYAMFVAGHRAKEQVGPSKICPICGGRYGAGTTFCGKDGSELVLVN